MRHLQFHVVLCVITALLGDHSPEFYRGLMAVASVRLEQPKPAQVSVSAPVRLRRTILVFTTRGCFPCRLQEAELAKLEAVGWIERDWSEDGVANIWVVKSHLYPGAAEHFRVTTNPTVLLLENGKVVQRFTGLVTAKQLSRLLNTGR
jgi:hypothetical protein